jgi:hypothetical protein
MAALRALREPRAHRVHICARIANPRTVSRVSPADVENIDDFARDGSTIDWPE